MKTIISFLLVTIVITVTQTDAAPQIQEGWRLPSETDMTGDWADFLGKNQRPYHARADFRIRGQTLIS